MYKLIYRVNDNKIYRSLIENTLEKLPLDNSKLERVIWIYISCLIINLRTTFQIRITEGPKYNHISTSYEISQGRLDLALLIGYKDIMQDIATLFFR